MADELNLEAERAAAAKFEADQADFEAWAKSHGGLPLDLAGGNFHTDDGLALPTYKFGRTEIAWRAWANKSVRRAAPAAAQLDADLLPPAWGVVETVGDMARNLLTLDQSLPIHAAFHVDIEGKRRCRTRPVTISRERVIDGKWVDVTRKDVPYAVIVWAKQDERAQYAERIRLLTEELEAAKLAPMCERKTDDIMQRDGYEKTGYVLKKAGERICVSDGGAVAWFTLDQWNWLMFNRDHVEFTWPKPLAYIDGRTAEPVAHEARRCKACHSPRKGETCQKCGGPTFVPHASWEEPKLPPVDRIRELAREVGYAIGEHGTKERDLDLIAAPWTEEAIGNAALFEHIAKGLGARVVDMERKPLGRYAATLQMDGWYKNIDLSVCPFDGRTASTAAECIGYAEAIALRNFEAGRSDELYIVRHERAVDEPVSVYAAAPSPLSGTEDANEN